MVDDKPDDLEPGRPKRTPPTLDLSATEIPRVEASDGFAGADETIVEEPPPRRASGIAAAAAAGAVTGAIVAGLVWFASSTWLTATPELQPVAPQANATRVDDIAARLGKLESRPMATGAAPDLSAIAGRLDALDKTTAGLRDETATLRAQSSQALTAASDAQKDVKSAPRPAAPDLSGITNRLAQLEASARAQNEKIAEQARKPIDELTTRRIATASLLDAQVRAGEPYAPALAAAKSLAPDAAKLTPLDAFATSGVPTVHALSRALLEMPQLAPPASSGTSGGLIARLKTGAENLVKIERTDQPNADNAIFARASAAARRDDIATAANELGGLPPSERAAVQPWLDRVAARNAALAASRQFADDALAALPKATQ